MLINTDDIDLKAEFVLFVRENHAGVIVSFYVPEAGSSVSVGQISEVVVKGIDKSVLQ